MIRTLLCQFLPWHKWVIRKKLSSSAEKLTCSCGRQYAIHHGMRAMLPWDSEIEDMYDRFARHSNDI